MKESLTLPSLWQGNAPIDTVLVQCGSWKLVSGEQKTVFLHEPTSTNVVLRPLEGDFLGILMYNSDLIISPEAFLYGIYTSRERKKPGLGIIKVTLCHIRQKIAQAEMDGCRIETVWGRGYRLRLN